MHVKKIVLIALSCFINVGVQANNEVAKRGLKTTLANNEKSSLMADKLIFPVITISGGISLAEPGNSQTHTTSTSSGLTNYKFNYAVMNTSTQCKALFGLFTGAEWRITPTLAWQPGVSYYQARPFKVTGKRTTTGLANQGTASYQHEIKSQQVLIENKLLMTLAENFHPYISLGLGVSINKASAFNEACSPSLRARRTTAYADHTDKTFAYKVGLGLDYDVIENWRIGLGYWFTSLGKANLGQGASSLHHGRSRAGLLNLIPLKQKLFTHNILVQLTYLY